jgi:hypothetical protein
MAAQLRTGMAPRGVREQTLRRLSVRTTAGGHPPGCTWERDDTGSPGRIRHVAVIRGGSASQPDQSRYRLGDASR